MAAKRGYAVDAVEKCDLKISIVCKREEAVQSLDNGFFILPPLSDGCLHYLPMIRYFSPNPKVITDRPVIFLFPVSDILKLFGKKFRNRGSFRSS